MILSLFPREALEEAHPPTTVAALRLALFGAGTLVRRDGRLAERRVERCLVLATLRAASPARWPPPPLQLALTAHRVLGATLSLAGGLASLSCSLLLPTWFYASLSWQHLRWHARAGLVALLAGGGSLVILVVGSNVCDMVGGCGSHHSSGGGAAVAGGGATVAGAEAWQSW